eukprot:404331_1
MSNFCSSIAGMVDWGVETQKEKKTQKEKFLYRLKIHRLKIHRHHQRLLVHGYCRHYITVLRFIPEYIINYLTNFSVTHDLTMGGDMNYEWFWTCPECDMSWSIARKCCPKCQYKSTSPILATINAANDGPNDMCLKGTVTVITGCEYDIGIETVLVLAMHGAKVYMLYHDLTLVSKIRQYIITVIEQADIKQFDPNNLVLMQMEFSLLSIVQFVRNFSSLNERIDYLINNAYYYYLGHFYLTRLLTPILVKSTARI